MQSNEILQTISQVAAALAGFSGVVAALGHRGSRTWSSEEILQLRTLVEPSLVALFGSFLPGTLSLAFDSEPLVWRLSNAALGLLGVVAGIAFIARSRFASATTGQWLLVVPVGLTVVALLLAAAGILRHYELIFVVALILALAVAAYNFLLLLVITRDGE
jgi:tellurite resistance protein TehA-like permease